MKCEYMALGTESNRYRQCDGTSVNDKVSANKLFPLEHFLSGRPVIVRKGAQLVWS